MPLDWIKNTLAQGRSKLTEEVGRFKNKETLDAIVAASTMMGFADGTVTSEEKAKMVGVLQASDELKVFKTDEVIAIFQNLSGKYDFDKAVGEMECLKLIGRVKGKPEAASLVVRVSMIIANADGNFDANERAVAIRIVREVGLDPAQFDLAA